MRRIFRNALLRLIALSCFCTAAHAFDTASFLDMSEDQQTFYLLGLIDSEILKPSTNKNCVLIWARDDMHGFLFDWYAGSEMYVGEVSVAFIISEELKAKCNSRQKTS